MQTLVRAKSKKRINPYQKTLTFWEPPPEVLAGNAPYLPSPKEIAAACALIQKEWTEEERHRRAGTSPFVNIPQAKDTGRTGGRNRHLMPNPY